MNHLSDPCMNKLGRYQETNAAIVDSKIDFIWNVKIRLRASCNINGFVLKRRNSTGVNYKKLSSHDANFILIGDTKFLLSWQLPASASNDDKLASWKL